MFFFSLVGVHGFLCLVDRYYRGFDRTGIRRGVIGLLALMMGGTVRFLQQMPESDGGHVLHLAAQVEGYEGVVLESVRHGAYGRLTLSLHRVRVGGKWKRVRGKVYVWLSEGRYDYGDVLRVKGRLKRIPAQRNPYTFDYRRQAAQRGVYHRSFVHRKLVKKLGYAPPSRVMVMAYWLRELLASRLRKRVTDPVGRAVTLAMVLGIREEMDKSVQASFADAGVLHILAVSGLHVGMIYAILLFLLSLLGLYGHRRRWWQGAVVLSVLWVYVLVTACAPSVVRAVATLSLGTMARLLRRQHHVVNGLAVTAFGSLLYQPLWWGDIGFQLSYLAVGGITFFYRRLYGVFKGRNRLLRYVGSMGMVSLSVQLTTLPLSLYYFHRFPTYLLLGNMVAVPLASVILALGLATCALGDVPRVGALLGALLSSFLRGLHRYACALQGLRFSRLGPFFPSGWEVVLGYGLIGSLTAFFVLRRFRYLLLAFLVSVGMASFSLVRWDRQWRQEAWIVYSVRGHRVFSLIQGRRALFLRDGPLDEGSDAYRREVLPSMEAMGVLDVVFCPFDVQAFRVGDELFFRRWRGMELVDWRGRRIVCLGERSEVPPRLASKEVIDLLIVDGYRLSTLVPWLAQLAPRVVVLGYGLTWRQRKRFKRELEKAGVVCHDLQAMGGLYERF
ncbi:MAG: ComEC/Rec2 family competence protein [Bacteroidota bacterium]